MRLLNLVVFFLLCLLQSAPAVSEHITLTVGVGRKTPSNPHGYFKGWGVNAGGISSKNYYGMASQSKRDVWANMYWRDTDMRHIRINAGNGIDVTTIYTAELLYSMYGQYISDIEKSIGGKIQKIYDPHAGWKYTDPMGSWSPAMTDSVLRVYISKNADVILNLKLKYGWDMSFVEITNEPQVYIDTTLPKNSPLYSWYNNDNRRKAVSMTKIWRSELDARGLHAVKVIGPSKSGVAAAFDTLIIKDFKADSVGLAAWHGFSFHSYTSPLTKTVVNALSGLDVDIFETESGQQPEQRGVANAISDINLGTNYWQHFQAYSWSGSNDTLDKSGVRFAGIIHPGTDSVYVFPYLRFYYFRTLMKAIPYGSKVFNTTATSSSWPATLTTAVRSRYSNMEPVDREQPPVNATAAELPDGRWSLVVFNPDSVSNAYNPYVPYKNMSFDVTFVVPQLQNKGDVVFKAYKVTKYKAETSLGSFYMNSGVVTIPGVSDGDLITLRSEAILADTIAVAEVKPSKTITDTIKYSVMDSVSVLTLSLDSVKDVQVALSDCSGSETGIAFSGPLSSGSHVVKLPLGSNWKGVVSLRYINKDFSAVSRTIRTVCGI